jgi:UPF0271 protein
MNRTIDLNCDLGEGAGNDDALMPLITSANIACGAHAGDRSTMRAAVRLARQHGVAIGAHPGFEDREHFGRRPQALAHAEIVALVRRQVEALRLIANGESVTVTYVKPHGALYNMAATDLMIANAVIEGVERVDKNLRLYGLAGGVLLGAAQTRGLPVASEVFADRSYQPNGSLTPRGQVGALIDDPKDVAAQALQMICEGRVIATNGAEVSIVADTLCLHGDGKDSVEFARRLRIALSNEGVRLRALD